MNERGLKEMRKIDLFIYIYIWMYIFINIQCSNHKYLVKPQEFATEPPFDLPRDATRKYLSSFAGLPGFILQVDPKKVPRWFFLAHLKNRSPTKNGKCPSNFQQRTEGLSPHLSQVGQTWQFLWVFCQPQTLPPLVTSREYTLKSQGQVTSKPP